MNLQPVFFERALLWIVLLPLLGAVLSGTLGVYGKGVPKKLVARLATGAVFGSFLLSIAVFAQLVVQQHGGGPSLIENDLYEWFSITYGTSGSGYTTVPIRVAFVADNLSAIMLLVITGIGTLIHVYSQEYMADDRSFPRFFAYLNLFTASMLILVLGSSLPVMFVGWEGVGLCSYLLIGFWYENPAYAAAGRKAFVVNRIGDFGVLIGTFVLFTATQSFEFAEINQKADLLTQSYVLVRTPVGMTATVAALFLFLGCAGKSAQIPLYVWLPDAMAGPTPVSALIHAATMVTAGVYLCCRLSDVFVLSPTAMAVIAVVGSLTALLAASIALVQTQMKKILAYSTVSQLGFMFAAVGSTAFAAGIFHVFTHAFFKACLFLGAGAVMHAVHAHGDADVRKLGGLRGKLPVVHATFLVSCLAIAGVPLFSGFFSKDEILLGTLAGAPYFENAAASVAASLAAPNVTWLGSVVGSVQLALLSSAWWFSFGALAIAATMTAYYMFRLYFLTFSGSYRSAEGEGHAGGEDGHGYDPHPHAPGFHIRMVLTVLGVGALAAGYLGLPHLFHLPNFWGDWLHDGLASATGGHGEEHGAHAGPSNEVVAMIAGSVAMAVGIGIAFVRFSGGRGVPAAGVPTGPASLLWNKWWVDEFYERTILWATRGAARISAALDSYFVDALLTKASSWTLLIAGWCLTRLQTGRVHGYGVAMVFGLLCVGGWFLYPRAELQAEVEGATVKWAASEGFSYSYEWDMDSVGTGPACGGPRCTTTVSPADHDQLVLLVRTQADPRRRDEPPEEVAIADGKTPLAPLMDGLPPELVSALAAGRVTVQAGYAILAAGAAPVALHAGVREVALTGDIAPAFRQHGDAHPPTFHLEGDSVVLDLAGVSADRVVHGEKMSDGHLSFGAGGAVVLSGTRVSIQRVAVFETQDESGQLPLRNLEGPMANGTFLAPGQGFQAAGQSVRIGVRLEGIVKVTNAFGAQREIHQQVTLEPPRPASRGVAQVFAGESGR